MDTICKISHSFTTPGRRQSKIPILSRYVDQKSIETVFSIAICSPIGNKWQSKTLFLLIFDPHWSNVDYVFDCRLHRVFKEDVVLWVKVQNFQNPELLKLQS